VNSVADGSWTKRISKNGGAWAAMTVTITFQENGWYALTLSTAHTDTLGILSMTFTSATTMQINLQFRVEARLNDDLAYPATSGRSLLVNTTGGTAPDWGQVQNPTTAVSLSGTNIDVDQVVASVSGAVGSVTGAVASVTGAVGSVTGNVGGNVTGSVGSVATGGITALSIATDAVNEIRDSILSDATPFPGGNINATISSRATPAQVNTEVLDVLTVDNFAELGAIPAANASIKDCLKWLFALARNKITQTAIVQTLRNDADVGTIASANVSDDGTTFTRSEWT
jgi:hypothetical protein